MTARGALLILGFVLSAISPGTAALEVEESTPRVASPPAESSPQAPPSLPPPEMQTPEPQTPVPQTPVPQQNVVREERLFEVKGRVEARAGASDDHEWDREYGLQAIFGANFRPTKWLKGQIEVDVSVQPKLRDAFARIDLPAHLQLQLGRFKAPFGGLEHVSRWDLPLVRRGALSEQLHGGLGYGDRRTGVMLAAKGGTWLPAPLLIEVGAFQGDPLPGGLGAEDLAGHVSARVLRRLTLGAGAYSRGALQPGAQGRWMLGGDAQLALGALQLWGEVMGGPEAVAAATLVAWRLSVPSEREWWFEPALGAELLRLADGGGEVQPLGVAALGAGAGKLRVRAQLELGGARQGLGTARTASFQVMAGAAL